MNNAEEYLKELDIIKDGYSKFWIHWKNRDSVELTKIMEAYANHRIKQLLDVSEEEIDDNFSKSPDNHIHPDRYRTEGAKWFRNHILNKLT